MTILAIYLFLIYFSVLFFWIKGREKIELVDILGMLLVPIPVIIEQLIIIFGR